MKKLIILLILVLVSATFGEISELPSWVDSAIEEGISAKKNPVCRIEKKALGIKLRYGILSTPYTRVKTAAYEAKQKFMKFTRENVTQDMLDPVAIAIIPPYIGSKIDDSHRGVEHVVILKNCKSKKPRPDEVIQPEEIKKMPASKSNIFGVKVEKEGIIATFPLETIKKGHCFLIMFEKKFLQSTKFKIKISKSMLKRAFGSH